MSMSNYLTLRGTSRQCVTYLPSVSVLQLLIATSFTVDCAAYSDVIAHNRQSKNVRLVYALLLTWYFF